LPAPPILVAENAPYAVLVRPLQPLIEGGR